jgi:hypothetical protein
MHRRSNHMVSAPWSPSVNFLAPIRPPMNSSLTVSVSTAANFSNSSTDIFGMCSAMVVMVHLLSDGHQCGQPVHSSGRLPP